MDYCGGVWERKFLTKEHKQYSKMLFVVENCILLANVNHVVMEVPSMMEAMEFKPITMTIINHSMFDGFVKDVIENGTNTTSQSLIELARPLLQQHGTLSTAYLMRKLKIDYEQAREIMRELGLPVWITAEEYHEENERTYQKSYTGMFFG